MVKNNFLCVYCSYSLLHEYVQCMREQVWERDNYHFLCLHCVLHSCLSSCLISAVVVVVAVMVIDGIVVAYILACD